MPKRKIIFDEYSRATKYRRLSKRESSSDETDDSSSTDDYRSDSCSDTYSSSSSSENDTNQSSDLYSGSSAYEPDFVETEDNGSKNALDIENHFECLGASSDKSDEGSSDIIDELHLEEYSSLNKSSEDEDTMSSSSISLSLDENSSGLDDSESESGDQSFMRKALMPIYPGAPITIGESVVSIFALSSRFKITGVFLSFLLQLTALHCTPPSECIKTLYKLKKFFANICSIPFEKRFYCQACASRLNSDFCKECDSSSQVGYFLQIPIIAQLASLYKRKGFKESLNYKIHRQKEDQNNYEDIFDGEIYNSLPENFRADDNNITFTWNTDGFALFKSSKFNIWPFYLMINELPYKLRIRKENMIVTGLWSGRNKPLPNVFLKAFKAELRMLLKGVEFRIHSSLNTICVHGAIIAGTCDLPAKALFLNLKQYNSRYGCPNCKIQTEREDNVQMYPYVENIELRNTVETKMQATEATQQKTRCTPAQAHSVDVFGVKGPSMLDKIIHNYIESTAIDEMHCVFLGITKKLMYFWFDTEQRTHDASLFQFINIINERIKKLTLPSFVPRIPREVSEYSYWKASELKIFLLIYSLALLKDLMSQQYFEHDILLVYGISLLNYSSVSEEMIVKAQTALNEYVSRFQILYGFKHRTCNLHLLLHLPNEVRKFGPLWVMSCFPFENCNGILGSFVHGSKNAELQIYSALSIFLTMHELKEKLIRPDSAVSGFCERVEKSGTKRYKTHHLFEDVFAVGAFHKINFLPDDTLGALSSFEEVINLSKVHTFKRLLKNAIYFESEMYADSKKTNSSCIKYRSNNDSFSVGIIQNFITLCKCECLASCGECNQDCITYVILKKCNVEPTFECLDDRIDSVFICNVIDNELLAVNVSCILCVCYGFVLNDIRYAILPLNNNEAE